MEQDLAVITSEHAWLRGQAEAEDGRNTSGIEDEVFAGWAVRILETGSQKRYVKVETHYGYTGYVERSSLRCVTEEELRRRQDQARFFRIGISEADLLDQPKVQGLPQELLLKNSIVELLVGEVAEGWCKVRTAAGREGFLHTRNLKKRMDSDEYLLIKGEEKKNYFQNRKNDEEETALREHLATISDVKTAYLDGIKANGADGFVVILELNTPQADVRTIADSTAQIAKKYGSCVVAPANSPLGQKVMERKQAFYQA